MENVAYRLTFENFNLSNQESSLLNEEFTTHYWKPSFKSLIPPYYPKTYLLFWIFYYLRVFSNRDYGVIYIHNSVNNEVAFYMMIVPRFFKYRFMSKNDVQLIYGITKEKYRRLGLAEFAMRKVVIDYNKKNRAFWGVIHKDNKASRGWVEKLGFVLKGHVSKSKFLKTMKILNL